MGKSDNTMTQPQQQVVIVNQNNSNGCGTAVLTENFIMDNHSHLEYLQSW